MAGYRAWIAAKGYEQNLIDELAFHNITAYQNPGRLFWIDQTDQVIPDLHWVQDVWYQVKRVEIRSISDAAKILRQHGHNWIAWDENLYHRVGLIKKKLPSFEMDNPALPFPPSYKDQYYGVFALLDANTMIYTSNYTNQAKFGVYHFMENKTDPPSRAYLKLWEALARYNQKPGRGAKCLDAGSAPGGWSWVLSELNCKVLAIDKAPLHTSLQNKATINWKKKDFFKMTPSDTGSLDWLVCDVICEPAKLYDWIWPWVQSNTCKNFICTLKMKGKPDFITSQKFAQIPDSNLIHLYHNKNELTWTKFQNNARQ